MKKRRPSHVAKYSNRRAVKPMFLRTKGQLAKEPDWKETYRAQVHEMVQ